MLTGGMRTRASKNEPWTYTRYGLWSMTRAILEDLEYQLEGRDY